MEYLSDFNDNVNSTLSFLDDPIVNNVLRLFLVLYGGLAAPQLPLAWGPMFTKWWFRILVMSLILWTSNRDPVISIMVAVGYFVSMTYFVKNGMTDIIRTGEVKPEVAVMISGGTGPNEQVRADAQLMQAQVNSIVSPGAPKAVLSTGPSTGANTNIATTPSETSASSSSMMAKSTPGSVPESFTPDELLALAVAPQ